MSSSPMVLNHCSCTAVDTSDQAWQQAELSLSRGGLGLHYISCNSPAAYIASLSSSGFSTSFLQHLKQAVDTLVPTSDAVCVEDVLISPFHQKMLSTKVDNHLFNLLLEKSSIADKVRLLSVSSPHAASWISVIRSEGHGLHLPEFHVTIKWWLGLYTSSGAMCALLCSIPLAITLSPASGVVMLSPVTISSETT